jgi:hypothetical protein
MAILYIREYADTGMYQNGQPLPIEPGADQFIAVTTTSAQSTTLKTNTRMVRVTADSPTNILFGTNPTAVQGTNLRITTGQTYDFLVPQSSGLKIAAVTSTI